MEETKIYEQLTDIFAKVFYGEAIKLTPDLTAKEVSGWDSLTHVRLLMTVQKAFKIKFTTGEISKLARVGDLVELIGRRSVNG